MTTQQKKVEMVLQSIDLRRDAWAKPAVLKGTARFTMGKDDDSYRSNESSTELNLVLTPDIIDVIVQACGDAIKAAAKKQAEAFYQNAKELTGNLLEAPKDE